MIQEQQPFVKRTLRIYRGYMFWKTSEHYYIIKVKGGVIK